MEPTVYLHGEFLAKSDAHLSPDDRGFLFADGLYEVIRSYEGRFFRAAAHLERMAHGLSQVRMDGVDTTAFEELARELIDRNGLENVNAIVYLQVTRGVAPRVHRFPDSSVSPTVYLCASALTPLHDPANGVAAITAPDTRWARCDIKSVGLLPNCLAQQLAYERGAAEAVFVRDGMALEGTHTSFFGVLDGVVVTAPLTNYILPSITRAAVLEVCAEAGMPCSERPIELQEVFGADELFLAGTTMEIMPITTLDGALVGSGSPGPVTGTLQRGLRSLIDAGAT